MKFTFSLKGTFNKLKAWRNRKVTDKWLHLVAKEAKKAVRNGMIGGPHTGRVYRIKGGYHQASVNKEKAEYPAKRSGKLVDSLKVEVVPNTRVNVKLGGGVHYAGYLRDGWRTKKNKRVAARKMEREGLIEGLREAGPPPPGWVGWTGD